MNITITNNTDARMLVQFQEAGKNYGATGGEGEGGHPFDQVEIPVAAAVQIPMPSVILRVALMGQGRDVEDLLATSRA
jgi:hypothetical protein